MSAEISLVGPVTEVDVSTNPETGITPTPRGFICDTPGAIACQLTGDTTYKTYSGILAGAEYLWALKDINNLAGGTTITGIKLLY